MTIKDFKALWNWCDCASSKNSIKGRASHDEFWHRFVAALSVYDTATQLRLMNFVLFMNKE